MVSVVLHTHGTRFVFFVRDRTHGTMDPRAHVTAGAHSRWPQDLQEPVVSGMAQGRVAQRAGRIAAVTNYTTFNLPPSLARRSLRFGTPLGASRYLPGPRSDHGDDPVFSKIFSFWNELDALMWNYTNLAAASGGEARVGRKHAWQTGYVRELQIRRMVELARLPTTSNYCEVGMNGGHSVSALLLANPRLNAHVFDIMILKYSRPVADLLTSRFGSRFKLVEGNSRATLPPWVESARAAGRTCDVTFVDGDHDGQGAQKDMKKLALVTAPAPHNRLIVDDIHMGPGWAILQEQLAGRVEVLEKYGPFKPETRENPCMRLPPGMGMTGKLRFELCHPWGFLVGRYVARKKAG